MYTLALQLVPKLRTIKESRFEESCYGVKIFCYDGVTQGSMLCPLLLSNYPYVGRLGLQGVSVATQGATDYLRISAQIKNVADRC